MKIQRWAVGSILVGQTWDDLVKRVFNTYEAAMIYVDQLNESRKYALVMCQDNEYAKGWGV